MIHTPEQRSALSRPARTSAVTVALGLVAALLVVAGTASPAQADNYTPPTGVKTNSPVGSTRNKWAINRHIKRTIDSVPRRQSIRVASWNIRSNSLTTALVDAHRRGVSVRIIVDRGNANPDNPNRSVDRLQRALSGYGNKRRPAQLRSGVRRCVRSCRGPSGIAHSKFFLFSQAGRARAVVINGSYNATDVAATHQWNDVFTTRGRTGIYREFLTVFNQMYADRPVGQGYRTKGFGNIDTLIYPWTGNGTNGDPTMRELNRISCRGARNTGNGRTVVKIAMTSWHGQRGVRIARKVRSLYDAGCTVKIIYAVMGNEVLRLMRNGRRGPIPFRQIVRDPDGDGVYDKYLHSKVMTVRGRYGSNRKAWVTINGSLNWTPAALASDEAVMRIRSRGIVLRYNEHVDYWFARAPRGTRSSSQSIDGRMTTRSLEPQETVIPKGVLVDGVDPYAKIQEN